GLEEIAETGVMLRSDLSHELLTTIFAPRTELHDGAVIIRGDGILAAAALLPLTEMSLSERFGTRHRAALGITEDTDAVAVVVSEENGQMSVVERARIVRVPTAAQLERALLALLETPSAPGGLGRRGRAAGRLRIARRRARRDDTGAPAATDAPAADGSATPGRGAAVPPMAAPVPGSDGTGEPAAQPPRESAGAHDEHGPAARIPEVAPGADEGGSTPAAAAKP
ncbi:MAG TPA: DNA integrity scanning protein DisA nucleotide-binding domain protein, partial [Candidatus Limnocylindrales bacterium]|nr:DNA integrity scanning protein DisA nucleotide-binding domain protein [Candidatus Limnocylindrales bacterium]